MILLHIFYKEWIKSRLALLGSLAIGLATTFYIFAKVENHIVKFGAKIYMMKVLYDNPPIIYYQALMYIPLIIALCVGITQYMPEVTSRRIRLTLHLPAKNSNLITYMALYGMVAITIANALIFGLFVWKNVGLFPSQITIPVISSMLPWFLVAYPAYNFIAMVAMEPNRWRQLIYTLVGYYALSPFIVSGGAHGSYFSSTPALLFMTIASFPLVLYTSYRFSKGER